MSEEKNNIEEIERLLEENKDEQSIFSIQNIYAMLILNWQWFLLSVFIFVCGALIYLRYSTIVYQVSAKVLIKDEQNSRRNSNQMLANMQEFGFLSTSEGIENEMEILQSSLVARDAVKHLKLYTEYRTKGRIKKVLIYKTQPVNVDLDEAHLTQFDKELLEGAHQIDLIITAQGKGYRVEGDLIRNGIVNNHFDVYIKKLPSVIKTKFGHITVSKNILLGKQQNTAFDNGAPLYITIRTPMAVAQSYVKSLTVAPTSKQTSIAELTLTNTNTRRAIDFLTQLVQCYNAQANADKNEVALKTEEFINSRLEKIDAELGSTESSLEQYKRRNAVTELSMDAGQSLQMSSQYATKLSEANSQIQLLDYLREFVDNHNNLYKIIPSNVGMTDQASTTLITSYNQTVQERNRLLKAASAQAPQVQTLTSTLDELQSAIRTALLQARRSADIQRQGIQNQYAKYQGRIGSTPEQERVLNQIGRQQEVKSGLYLLLLQKREENSISLAATADKGRMIDEPQFGGKVSPKSAIIILAAIILGVGIPFLILYLIQLMSYRIEGHDDVARITDLPIIVDVPVANENVKDVAGIVVRANKNSQMDEIFRSMRTNLLFMMKEDENTILFTSSTSGEGKTFLAANLAVSFALLGKKVILCGLDIRKPALGRLFDLKDRTTGITQLLVKDQVTEQDINTTICPSGVNENLDLLLAGPIPPNPTELLARETFGNIMEILKKKYDYVILDTAPVGLVTDTLQIGRYANVSCFVVRADYTPKSNIGMVNQLTAEEKMKNTCLILNGVDMSKKKYGYYYGYGKYGKYGRYGYGRYGYGRYGYGRYGYGNYGSYGNYADSHYGNKNDDSIKK